MASLFYSLSTHTIKQNGNVNGISSLSFFLFYSLFPGLTIVCFFSREHLLRSIVFLRFQETWMATKIFGKHIFETNIYTYLTIKSVLNAKNRMSPFFSWSIGTFGANDSNNGDSVFLYKIAARRTEHPKWAIATTSRITITAKIRDFNKYFLVARVNCIHFVQRTWKTLAFFKNVCSARGVRST